MIKLTAILQKNTQLIRPLNQSHSLETFLEQNKTDPKKFKKKFKSSFKQILTIYLKPNFPQIILYYPLMDTSAILKTSHTKLQVATGHLNLKLKIYSLQKK